MWPKALAQLIELAPHAARLLPMADKFFQSKTAGEEANRKAMPGADTSQWVQPADIASLILWLASDAGKDVNGAAIPVYGRGL